MSRSPISSQSELPSAMGWASVKNPKRSPSVALPHVRSTVRRCHRLTPPHNNLIFRQDKLGEARHLPGTTLRGQSEPRSPPPGFRRPTVGWDR